MIVYGGQASGGSNPTLLDTSELLAQPVSCASPTPIAPTQTPPATATRTAPPATVTRTAGPTNTPICPPSSTHYFVATLNGQQETPPNTSPATGQATFFLDANGVMSYNVTFSGLSATETGSHLHVAPPGVAGPIIQPLPLGNPKVGSFTWNPAYTGDLLAGNVYVNIHSTNFPGGEIRGQLIAVCATPTPRVTTTPAPPTATTTPCNITFTDVHPSDYFYEPVRYLYCHNVISGYADNTFRPYNNTTRSQMVKIVVLGFNKPIATPTAGGYTFTDVPPSNPFFNYIETAASLNIVSGYTCGTVPEEPCDPRTARTSAHMPT